MEAGWYLIFRRTEGTERGKKAFGDGYRKLHVHGEKNTILRRITFKSLGVIRDVTDTGDNLLIVKLIDTPYFIAIHLIKCVITLYVSIADVRTCFA